MAHLISTSLAESQSTNRPPLFLGTNFSYQKARMKIFIQASDYNLQSIIVNGPHIPTRSLNNLVTIKPKCEQDDNDRRMAQLNTKAINVLCCALSVNEFNRVSSCSLAKEIWDRLEVTHEETNQVKEIKINILVHKYELFKIKPTESIIGLNTRFTDIVNNLKNLGKTYIDSELCRKILRSLPRSQEAKVNAIQEAKDLTYLKLEELLGSLMTHELALNQHNEEELKKKKSITLKDVVQEESEESDDKDESEPEIALLDRKIRRFMRKKKTFARKKIIDR